MTYLETIRTGLIVFPFLAAAFTLPYALSQYRRYGAVSKYRTLIVYTFMLYMLVIYFMVILPLPERESVEAGHFMEHVNLIPLKQIWLYWKDKPLGFGTMLGYLKSFSLWQLLFNVLLTVPFGVYLRYYFRKDLKQTLLYSFLLSLFFELTQLSALYGIYPGPYRLADVEDLICNSLGGLLGYQTASLFLKILPDRDKIDADTLIAGRTVTGRRRLLASIVDFAMSMVLFTFLQGVALILFHGGAEASGSAASRVWSFFCVFCLVQVLLTRGYTLGHALCRLRLRSTDGKAASAKQMIKRYGILWCFIELTSILSGVLRRGIPAMEDSWIPFFLVSVSDLYVFVYFLRELFGRQQKGMPHDKWSDTAYASCIGEEETKE